MFYCNSGGLSNVVRYNGVFVIAGFVIAGFAIVGVPLYHVHLYINKNM